MGLSPLALRVIARTVDTTQLYQGCGSDRATMLNWTSFRAFERGYVAEAPIRVIPRVGSAYKPKGYSSHPPNQLSILLVFYRDNHYRCSYLSESRTTTAVRSTSNIGACPVVPPTRAVTDKVNRLLTLSCVCSEELDFRTIGHLTATSKDQTHDGIRLSCRSDTIPAQAPWGHPTPYLQERQSIQVPTNKYNQEESLSMVHLRWFDRVTSGKN